MTTSDDWERNRKRNKRHTIRTTPEEEAAIDLRRAETQLSFNDFMIHMAIYGIYVKQDFESVRELSHELNKIGTNINQIAHQVNTFNTVQNEDLKYIKKQMEKMWSEYEKLLRRDLTRRERSNK